MHFIFSEIFRIVILVTFLANMQDYIRYAYRCKTEQDDAPLSQHLLHYHDIIKVFIRMA